MNSWIKRFMSIGLALVIPLIVSGCSIRLSAFAGSNCSTLEEYSLVQGDVLTECRGATSPQDQASPLAGDRNLVGIGSGAKGKLWPNGTVYFNIDSDIPKSHRVYDAISRFNVQTNLTFAFADESSSFGFASPQGGWLYANHQVPNYIRFVRSRGWCASHIGMQGGEQIIFIGDECDTRDVMHEIGHAVGLYHEQTRSDRDQFIRINWENILPGAEVQYAIDTNDSRLASRIEIGAFNIDSVMMSPPTAFSRNRHRTMQRLDSREFSSDPFLNDLDIQAINTLYANVPEPIVDVSVSMFTLRESLSPFEEQRVRYHTSPDYRRMWGLKTISQPDGSEDCAYLTDTSLSTEATARVRELVKGIKKNRESTAHCEEVARFGFSEQSLNGDLNAPFTFFESGFLYESFNADNPDRCNTLLQVDTNAVATELDSIFRSVATTLPGACEHYRFDWTSLPTPITIPTQECAPQLVVVLSNFEQFIDDRLLEVIDQSTGIPVQMSCIRWFDDEESWYRCHADQTPGEQTFSVRFGDLQANVGTTTILESRTQRYDAFCPANGFRLNLNTNTLGALNE